jgi:thiamine-phosphate pyrophosphorylase
MAHSPLQGLYVLLDPSVCPSRRLVDILKEAADHGVGLFQYRDKQASMRDAYQRGSELRRAAGDAGARLIVNDRCDLAVAIDADGVHVGQADLPPAEARFLLGREKILGVSTHTLEQVIAATKQDLDYIAYGPIFPTSTKLDHETVVGIEALRHIRQQVFMPLFAIGGITARHASEIGGAGADGIAVCSAVLQAPDVGRAVEDFMTAFRKSVQPRR